MNKPFAITKLFQDSRQASPLLFWSAAILLAAMLAFYGLLAMDPRLFNGVSVWEKPAKFALSLAVLMITVAWAMSLLEKPARGIKTSALLLVIASFFEIAYIAFRAARGEASHFNTGEPVAAALYALMGIGALTLTGAAAFVGWRVWQQRDGRLMHEAAGIGLILGAILATMTAGVLSSLQSHWIGGDQTDATGLGFFHWSTTGGDLRVAHFVGLHAMQFLPLAALTSNRTIVYAVACATVLLTGLTFAQAMSGMPLLRG